MARQQSLFSRRRHADEEAIRSRRSDLRHQFALLLRPEIPVTRTGRLEFRKSVANVGDRCLQHVRTGTQKIGTIALGCAQLDHALHQIDARYALGHADTQKPGRPNDAGTIDADDVARTHVAIKLHVRAHGDELRHIDAHMLQRLAALNGSISRRDRLREVRQSIGTPRKSLRCGGSPDSPSMQFVLETIASLTPSPGILASIGAESTN
jgi:hypothetical protein